MPSKKIQIIQIEGGFRRKKHIQVVEEQFVNFLGSPLGIIYNINGKQYGHGQTAELERGNHTYSATADNHSPKTGTFVVGESDLTVSETLVGLSVTLRVVCSVADAEIFVDSVLRGQTVSPEKVLALGAGEHAVTVSKLGFRSITKTVSVLFGETKILQFDLQANTSLVGQGPAKSFIHFTSNLNSSNVFVDELYRGLTPLSLELPPGSYATQVMYQGWSKSEQSVILSVSANVIVAGSLRLLPTTGEIFIDSNTEKSEVWFDSSFQGYTPFRKVLLPGTIFVVVKKSGFNDYSETVKVLLSETKSVYAKLTRITYPARGILVREFCTGFDRFGEYHDGAGGRYQTVIEKNSITCNAPQTAKIRVRFFDGGTEIRPESFSLKNIAGAIILSNTIDYAELSAGQYTGRFTANLYNEIDIKLVVLRQEYGQTIEKIVQIGGEYLSETVESLSVVATLIEPNFFSYYSPTEANLAFTKASDGISFYFSIGSKSIFGNVQTKGRLSVSGQTQEIGANSNTTLRHPLGVDVNPASVRIINENYSNFTGTGRDFFSIPGTSRVRFGVQGGVAVQTVTITFTSQKYRQLRTREI